MSNRRPSAYSIPPAVNIGCVAGDTKYFLLTESDRINHKLPLEAVRPVLSKARHLSAARITKAEWQRLHERDERVWLFYPDAKTLQIPSVREYIRHGKRVCYRIIDWTYRLRGPWPCSAAAAGAGAV